MSYFILILILLILISIKYISYMQVEEGQDPSAVH